MLGGGNNLLIRDDPIPGAVVRLTSAPFTMIEWDGKRITAARRRTAVRPHRVLGASGADRPRNARRACAAPSAAACGATSATKPARSARAVRQVTVMTDAGKIQVRTRDELTFSEHQSDIDEPVILSVVFELEKDAPEAVLKRMRKAWILRKAAEPLSFQSAVRLFRNPPGQTAAALIDRASMTKARVGGAELSERNSNYVVAHPGTTAADILQLADHVRGRVKERTGANLERELHVW